MTIKRAHIPSNAKYLQDTLDFEGSTQETSGWEWEVGGSLNGVGSVNSVKIGYTARDAIRAGKVSPDQRSIWLRAQNSENNWVSVPLSETEVEELITALMVTVKQRREALARHGIVEREADNGTH